MALEAIQQRLVQMLARIFQLSVLMRIFNSSTLDLGLVEQLVRLYGYSLAISFHTRILQSRLFSYRPKTTKTAKLLSRYAHFCTHTRLSAGYAT